MKPTTLLTILIICIGCYTAQAQNAPGSKGVISGLVRTDGDQPADYATIKLLAGKDSSVVRGTLTDETGRYLFSNVKAGEYFISVIYMGYRHLNSGKISIKPADTTATVVNLLLERDSKQLTEVIITGKVPYVENRMDKTILNVENSITAAGGNALEIIQKAPGVSIDKDDNISLKGKKGIVIMIDGKSMYLSPAELSSVLRNMNGNAISQIEIIANPSAKYDAEGNGGMINIKTKKLKKEGMNGTISSGVAYSKNIYSSSGLSMNYRNGNMNLFGSYNYAYNPRSADLNIRRRVAANQGNTDFKQITTMDNRYNNHSVKAGVDYSLNSRNTLGLLINGYLNKGNGLINNNTAMFNDKPQADSTLHVAGRDKNKFGNQSYNLNYKSLLDSLGMELSVDLDYSKFTGNRNNIQNNFYFNQTGGMAQAPEYSRSFAPSTIDIRSAKIDYVLPLDSKMKIETGLKVSLVKSDNDYRFENLQNNIWGSDLKRSNHFVYDENISAAYINMAKTYKNTSVQIGLRAENTHSKGNSLTTNSMVDTSYFRIFPNVSLTHKVSENHEIGFSYNSRIGRPGYDDLNPFLILLDKYTYEEGNPYLRPQFSNSFVLTYTYKNYLTGNLEYSHTKDVFVSVTEQNDLTKTTKAIEKNLKAKVLYSAGLQATIPFASWWSSSNSLQSFYLKYSAEDLNGGKASFQFNSSHDITLSKSWRAELNGNYQSALNYSIFNLKAQYQVNAGLQKNILNSKGSLKLSINDIFNTQSSDLSTTYRNMNLNIVNHEDTRKVHLSFNYRFGKNDFKARQRNSGSLEEQSRIKGGN